MLFCECFPSASLAAATSSSGMRRTLRQTHNFAHKLQSKNISTNLYLEECPGLVVHIVQEILVNDEVVIHGLVSQVAGDAGRETLGLLESKIVNIVLAQKTIKNIT